ncbi:PX domain protein [Gregarina niphandrodes]|uniref:PX domain protein n=1 Tax=Gregarina niphandrodes TaxID=110365 RepID=A0A023B552_GRENI|nr:PX domain protein [Gregarina niphandrodes]EZG58709.1 PX domain protein [Gregarina niphandrodes]|eukprot:XP_011130944.1 PX domain protein [Gregarina niphandrodes]
MHYGQCTTVNALRSMHYGQCTTANALRSMHYGQRTTLSILEKRFSEFHALHNSLFAKGYGNLPTLPSKTLTRPNDPGTAEQRQQRLNGYLRTLCVRPDIRQSETLIKFLRLDLDLPPQVPLPLPLEIWTMTHSSDFGAFSVMDFGDGGPISQHKVPLFVCAMSDTTALSKLGKAWSVIDPEYVGALAIYRPVLNTVTESPVSNFVPGNSVEDPLKFVPMFTRQAQKRICIARFIPTANKAQLLLVGDGEGLLSVYEIRVTSATTAELSVLSTCEMHIKAAISQVVDLNGIFGSVGADNGLRIFEPDLTNYQLKICSMGKVSKPLKHPKETLTSICLLSGQFILRPLRLQSTNSPVDATASVASEYIKLRTLIGTNCGQLLLYDTEEPLPKFVGAINLGKVIRYIENPFNDKEEEDIVLGNSITHMQMLRFTCRTAVDSPQTTQRLSGPGDVSGSGNVSGPGDVSGSGDVAGSGDLLSGPQYSQSEVGPIVTEKQSLVVSIRGLILLLNPCLVAGRDITEEINNLYRCLTSSVDPAYNPIYNHYVWKVLECPMESYHKATVTAMCAWGHLLFCSYQRGVCVFDLSEGELLSCLDQSRWGTIRKLQVMPIPSSSSATGGSYALFAATSLGGLRVLNIDCLSHSRIWRDGTKSEMPITPYGAVSYEESLGNLSGGGAPMPLGQVTGPSLGPPSGSINLSPRGSSECAALTLADEIDEIYSAFRPIKI